ncbi:hypothetical protein [Bryobacter aggregatus]|uniref:hypothetical protein n=1 Tax=Bryobacter aggregatus TaxID=360054 RepID=UPI0004E17351|nr:hypothetical protein [Bryobacter aggregatus]
MARLGVVLQEMEPSGYLRRSIRRLQWRERVRLVDPEKLIFLDESGVATDALRDPQLWVGGLDDDRSGHRRRDLPVVCNPEMEW